MRLDPLQRWNPGCAGRPRRGCRGSSGPSADPSGCRRTRACRSRPRRPASPRRPSGSGAGLERQVGDPVRGQAAAGREPRRAGGQFQPVDPEGAAIREGEAAVELGRARRRPTAAGPGSRPSMRAARSRASRRSAPMREIFAAALGADLGPGGEIELGVPRVQRPASRRGRSRSAACRGCWRPSRAGRPPARSDWPSAPGGRPSARRAVRAGSAPPRRGAAPCACRSSPSLAAPSRARPSADSRAGCPATGSPSTSSASVKPLISTLTGRSGSSLPSGLASGGVGPGTGRRSTSSRPISRLSTSSRPDSRASRRQTMRALSSFSQTPSRSLTATSRMVASEDRAPSTAPMATRDDGVDSARDRRPAEHGLVALVGARRRRVGRHQHREADQDQRAERHLPSGGPAARCCRACP